MSIPFQMSFLGASVKFPDVNAQQFSRSPVLIWCPPPDSSNVNVMYPIPNSIPRRLIRPRLLYSLPSCDRKNTRSCVATTPRPMIDNSQWASSSVPSNKEVMSMSWRNSWEWSARVLVLFKMGVSSYWNRCKSSLPAYIARGPSCIIDTTCFQLLALILWSFAFRFRYLATTMDLSSTVAEVQQTDSSSPSSLQPRPGDAATFVNSKLTTKATRRIRCAHRWLIGVESS